MALFSDIDWVIIAGTAAFLLFGRENAQFLRTLGRWYARVGRLKQELLSEITKAADLPSAASSPTRSVRGTLLGLDPPLAPPNSLPSVVRVPIIVPSRASLEPNARWSGDPPVPTWSVTVPAVANESEVTR